MENSLPPDIVARVLDLERRMNNQERQQNPPAPGLFDLDDVNGMPVGTEAMLVYDRSTGTWKPDASGGGQPGDIKFTASPDTPQGRWLRADGTPTSRTQFAELFSAIGTYYGAGDGSTTFNLPDLSSRMPIGVGIDALGSTGGERTHTLTSGEMPSHTHAQVVTAGFTGGTGDRLDYDADFASGDAAAFDQGVTTGGTGGGGAHNNMPPYIALYAYIRY